MDEDSPRALLTAPTSEYLSREKRNRILQRIETLQKTVAETAESAARMDATEDLHRVVHTVSAQQSEICVSLSQVMEAVQSVFFYTEGIGSKLDRIGGKLGVLGRLEGKLDEINNRLEGKLDGINNRLSNNSGTAHTWLLVAITMGVAASLAFSRPR